MFETTKTHWWNFQRASGTTDTHKAIKKELAQAELSLLEAQSGLEWATAMVQYNKSRVQRLRDLQGPSWGASQPDYPEIPSANVLSYLKASK